MTAARRTDFSSAGAYGGEVRVCLLKILEIDVACPEVADLWIASMPEIIATGFKFEVTPSECAVQLIHQGKPPSSKLVAYASAHRRYVQGHRPAMYADLMASELWAQHLLDVTTHAVEQEERLTIDLISQARRDPELADNYLKKVAALEAIPHVVEELILHRVIYQPGGNG